MSEQVLVSRDALRRVLEQIEIPANGSTRVYFVATNEFRAAYLALSDALTAPAPAEADAERDLRLWMAGLDGGASSEAIACACLRIEPRFGHFSPPHDSDDLGRCLRLIDAIPEAREGVRILAARDLRWARLEPIWDQLAEMGTAAGLLEKGGWHPEINVLIRAALNPEATP